MEFKGDKYIFTYKRTYMNDEFLPTTSSYMWTTNATSLKQAYKFFLETHEEGTHVSKVVVEKQEVVVFGE